MRKARFIENCRCYHLISQRSVGRREDLGTAGGRADEAVGIRSSIHFNRYYLSPLLEKGIFARTDPDHPQSPQQRYCLT